ncbi:MAG: DUF2723 domain-containing protein [Deltaproteobacteria bacterium]|nr:DUF2723 domain-containing protein [Deltaproteobacteria bacterium]
MAGSFERWVVSASAFGAFAVPLAASVLAASPEPYWLDSPEFTAAAQTLGIPHPPGHPLYVMLVKPFTLLPLGGIAFRVALASAVFGALASLLVFKLAFAVLGRATPELPRAAGALFALVAALLVAVSPGFWFQCVRAEVYSLEILLVLAALTPLVLFCLDPAPGDDRLLLVAAFAFGLGLANHHFITLGALPAAVPVFLVLWKTRGGRATRRLIARLAGFAAAGLLPYAFIPIRSAAGASVSLGGVHSVGDFLWVVSAKVYQKAMQQEYAAGLPDRSLDVFYSMMGELGPVVVVAALAGLYLLLRRPASRLAGVTLGLVAAVTLVLRAVMGLDPFNPDYYGYMLPAVACLGIAFAALPAAIGEVVSIVVKGGPLLTGVLAAALVAVPVLRGRDARAKVDLSDFCATRLYLDLALEEARPGTLVLTNYYKLFFVLWSARFVDGSRPDVTVVNPGLLSYPGYLSSTLRARPDLRGLAWSMVVNGKVSEPVLAELALAGPLRVEPDLSLDEQALRYLKPDGLVYAASPEPLSLSDVIEASKAQRRRWERFYDVLGPAWSEHETWRMLSWSHYLEALFLARRGDREGAAEAVRMALALGNDAPQLKGLARAIASKKKGPVDVTPFLPGAPLRSEEPPAGDVPR